MELGRMELGRVELGRVKLVSTPASRPEWEQVLAGDPDALADHSPRWLDAACSDGRFADVSRLYTAPDGRLFVLPLVRRRGVAVAGGWWAGYPTGWGIGGLVGPGQDARVIAAVLDDLGRHSATGPVRIWLRPDPTRAALWAEGSRLSRSRVLAVARRAHVLDLTGGADAVLARMPKSTRRGIRVAQRHGVRVEVGRGGELLAEHRQLHDASVRRWAGHQHEPLALARWRDSRRDPARVLDAVARQLGDDLVVLVAFVGDRPVASNVTVLGASAHDTRAAIDRDLAGPVRAAELLQWRAIELACAAGCRVHHLGESGRAAGLSAFKERFGAVAVDYAEYRLERVPWTRADTAARGAVKRLLRFRDVDQLGGQGDRGDHG